MSWFGNLLDRIISQQDQQQVQVCSTENRPLQRERHGNVLEYTAQDKDHTKGIRWNVYRIRRDKERREEESRRQIYSIRWRWF